MKHAEPTRRRSLLLGLYRLVTFAAEPVAPLLLRRRSARGKEDPGRLGERVGIAGAARPDGTLIWLHGASVGEAASLLPLISALSVRGCRVLITTGTLTSAQFLARRLPAGVIHQFIPIDVGRFFRRFLLHWRPDLVLLAESELWPNLIWETHRAGVPMISINARMSARSVATWARLPSLIGAILHPIALVLAQSVEDADRFIALGAPRVRVAGNLKYDVPPPAVDHDQLGCLSASIGPRPAWIAASTHEGEERMAADVHVALSRRFSGLLTIVAPRHPERGSDLTAMFKARGLNVAVRSAGEIPSTATNVYLADTIGDLGIVYRLAEIVFLGKSAGTSPTVQGGHNPIEPVLCGCVVLHGRHVGNFAETFRLLDDADAAQEVAEPEHLAAAVADLLADPSRTRAMARRAAAAIEQQTGTLHRILQALAPYLPSADAAGSFPESSVAPQERSLAPSKQSLR